MQISKSFFNIRQIPLVVICLFILDVFFCFAYIGTHVPAPLDFKAVRYWDLDFEGGIATWYSAFQLLGIAILSTLFVRKKAVAGQGSPVLIGLPIIFLSMGIDEIARIHERIGKYSDILLPAGSRANTPFQETGIWVFLVGIPFIIFFLVWLYKLRKHLIGYGAEINRLGMGVLTLLFGALGIELLSNFLYHDSSQLIGIALEEGLEMIGATVIFWAVLSMLKKKRPPKLSRV
ncbi:MAG: hypothetical protein ACFB14_04995 [Leptolyngbyaceae cyanobacterium]